MKEGKLRVVQRAKILCAVDAAHKTKNSVRSIADDILKRVNVRRCSPETITTMGDFVERIYLPRVAEQNRASTSRGYRNAWRRYLAPHCHDWWLQDTRTSDVQQVLDSIANTHDLSRPTLRHLKALLSGIFNHAKQQGYYDAFNPVHGVAIPKARSGGETHAYSLEEIQDFLMSVPEPGATALALLAFTGIRRSEGEGLRWQDYDADGKQISITRSIWNGIVDEPKTRKSRSAVPVIKPLATMLEIHRLRSGNPKEGPIFRNRNGKPLSFNNLANRIVSPALQWCKVCGKSRLNHDKSEHDFKRDETRIRWRGWHALRRGLATNLYRLGVPDKTIQAILRHANLSTTMNVYVKAVAEDSVKAMKTLEALSCANTRKRHRLPPELTL